MRDSTSSLVVHAHPMYPLMVRQVPFEARNRTPKAQRKVKSLAKQSTLPLPLVEALVSRSRNYDKENFCWVPNEQMHEIPEASLEVLEDGLRWSRQQELSVDEVVARALAFAHQGLSPHIERFLNAVPVRNSWAMSPLMTSATLRGLSRENLSSCPPPGKLDFSAVCTYAGAKLGLSLAPRTDLGFAAVEAATIELGTDPPPSKPSWLTEVCANVEALGNGSSLTDIVKATAKPLGGNKYTRMKILEALALVGVLRTGEFNPGEDFLPSVARGSSHFYSNEWRFPMNFWTESGSVVGPDVLLRQL